VDAITETLTEKGLVLRYRTDEMSTDGAEGTFLVCTFWLVQALAQHGDDERAGAVFERALGVSNDVGLLAEEYDVKHERMVSNFPQACAGWLSR
jgi:alpha,alpha-trehalase